VALLAAPCGLVAIAPLVGPVHWSLDLMTCFVVQAGVGLAVAAAAFAVGRKWTWAAIAAAFAAAAAATVTPAWLTRPGSPPPVQSGQQIVFAAVNLLAGNDQDPQLALKAIHTADVVWFSEYTPTWQRFLREALPEHRHRLERPDLGSFGAALYSRFPFDADAALVPGGHSWSPFGRATIRSPYGPIGVLGVHPPPPLPNTRGVAERDRGLAAIAPLLQALPPQRVVLGDFNATPWNDAFQRMRRDAGLGHGSAAWWLPSWPDPLPALLRTPIDHVLTSGRLTVTAATLGPSIGSDHRPLIATVRVDG